MLLTRQQAAIVSETEHSFRVLAAAGSGKTTTMAQYVKSELDSKRLTESQICFITFTRFAADQIRTKVKKVLGRSTQILYGTFHATMAKLLSIAGIEQADPIGLYDARMEEWVRNFIELMENKDSRLVQVLSKFKLLIVDEFQDLDPTQFIFVKLFKAIQPALRIVAIGDLAQNIYRFRGTSNEFLRTKLQLEICPQLRTFELTTNFRSSKSILTAVNTVFGPEIRDGHILPMAPAAMTVQGSKPKYYEYAKNPGKGLGEYEELVVTTLYPVLKAAKEDGKSVALIFPIIKCSSFQIITALLRQISRQNGYTFDIHQIAKEDVTCSTVTFDYDPRSPGSPIQCASFHASKGLEWDVVALINMSDDMYMIRGEEEETEAFYAEKTNLAYVGITRAIEELYIFADANRGGRSRIFSRLDPDTMADVMDVTLWGTDDIEDREEGRLRPIGITDLLRKLPQHPDLFERIKKCSQAIRIHDARDGCSLPMEYVYMEMKKRNREMAFGTYVDWKLKQILCSNSNSMQNLLVELKAVSEWSLSRMDAYDTLEMRLAKLDVFFMNSDKEPSEELIRYVTASRYLALFSGRLFGMVPVVKDIWCSVQKRLMEIAAKTDVLTVVEEYILSQSANFYLRGAVSEIQAVDAPCDSYQGLPNGFEEFTLEAIRPAAVTLETCVKSVLGADNESVDIQCDISVETESLILGEVDMVTGDLLIEIKCGNSTKAVELRDSGNCKNLLQVLSYVALGRHGVMPLACKYGCLINPLTATWEIYDMETWSVEDSAEFVKILEELRRRV